MELLVTGSDTVSKKKRWTCLYNMLPFFSSISGEISIMNSLRKFVSSVKVLAVTLVLLLSFFSSAAMADEATCIARGPITIENGSFDPRFRTSKCSIKKYIVFKSPKIIPGQEYFSFH